MAFLEENRLNVAIEDIIGQSIELITIVSPYIKLHERLKSKLQEKQQQPKVKIVILFRKDDENIAKNLGKEDYLFFKNFPNIEIRQEKRLHAKYYANEISGIITSMNLYDYSQNNNIEVGYKTKDYDSYEYFDKIIKQAELVFKVTPNFQKGNLGFTTKYIDSPLEIDLLSTMYANADKKNSELKPQNQSTSSSLLNNTKNVDKKNVTPKQKSQPLLNGFCIRTGVPIPFNINKPMCLDAYEIWSEFENENYSEKFCHFSGEPSNGETSMKAPVLRKNYKKAKEKFNL